jgi:hypothetical protein
MTDAEWEAWCATPGTDAFGHPWSSWIRNPKLIGKPMRASEYQVEPQHERTTRNRAARPAQDHQMELGL